ncbi:MAG: FAD-dependent oxidoreductase [Chloroflexota bacterium]
MVAEKSPEILKTDIVVIGGGGAGLSAAAQAAELGMKVIVLEKRRVTGGNTAMAHGFFAAESPAQKRRMIDAPKDELFKFWMDYHHWTVNPRLVRAFIDKSADTVRWLEEKGLNIDLMPAVNPWYFYRTFHMAFGAGRTVVKVLEKSCQDLRIKVLYQSSAKKLLTDRKGNVNGVLAATKDGELKVEAKAVIISTGGYGGNKKLLKKHCPQFSENTTYVGLKELTGDGLLMATEIGATTEGLGLPHYWGHRYSGSYLVNLVNQRPEAIWVNKNGERYCDEGILFDMGLRGNLIDRQPGKLSYTIIDEQIKKNLLKEGVIGAQVSLRWGPPDMTWAPVMEQLPLEVKGGNVKIGSLAEISKWMGASPATLKATVDEYNIYCDCGHDALFVKDRRFLQPLRTPPYYAVKFEQTLLDTMGGIKTNHHLEILNTRDKPIPGLYAAGVCVGGHQSAEYDFALSGSMFGFALNSGRIAAESAAKYIAGR